MQLPPHKTGELQRPPPKKVKKKEVNYKHHKKWTLSLFDNQNKLTDLNASKIQKGNKMKKMILIGFLIFSVNNLFAAWGWSSGSFLVDRYIGSTVGGQAAICLYIINPSGTTSKYFIRNPESTVSKAVMSEIVSGKVTSQPFKIYYDGLAVEGDWFELGAVKF